MSFISNEGLGSSHPSIPINQNQDISALLNSGQVSGNLLNSLNNGSTLLQQTNNNQHTLNDLSTIILQQQLLSQLQQNSGNSNQSSFIGTGNGQVGNIITNTNPSNNAAIYQQLLNQQHQQQQQQNSILLNAATAQNQQPSLSQLLQLQQVQNQLQNCGNLQNSSLQTQNIQQYNSAFKSQTQIPPQQSPQQQGSINPTILQQLINAGVSPAILAKLLSGNSQPTNQVNYSPATATQANFLLQQQLHLANQPQMQQNLQQQINKMIEAHKQQQLAEKRAMEERHMLNQLLVAANQNNTVGVSLPLPFQGNNNNNLAQQLQVQGISTEEDTQKFIKEYMLKQSGSLNNTPILAQQTHQQLQNQTHQVLVSTGNGIINGLQNQPLLQQQQQAQQLSATINLPQSISIPQSTSSSTPLTKEPSSVQLLKDPKSVTNHIQQLINRNEAIIEPSPVLTRRRPYCRQPSNTTVVDNQLASISNRSSFSDKESPTNQINSGGIEYNQTINSNSLESCIRQTSSIEMVNNIPVTSLPSGTGNGSLTNGQPFIRDLGKIHPRGFACEFCNLLFPNKAGLQAHSFRCSRNEEGESINKDSSNSGNVVTPTNVSLPNNNVDNGIMSSTLTPNPLKQQECDNRGSSNLSTNSSMVGNSLKRSFPSIDCMAEDVIKNLPFKLFKMKDLRQMSEQSFSEFAAEAKNIIPTIDQGLLKPGDDENVLIELRTKMLKHAIKKVADYDSNVEENAWNNLLKSDNNLQQQQQSNAPDFIKQEIPGVVDGQKNDNNNKTNELSNVVRNSGLLSDNNIRNQSLMDTLSLSPSTHQNIKTAVESAVSYVRQNVSAHMPYSVTINNLSSENQGTNISDESQDAKSSLPNKHRSRNITSETYFCVNTLPVHEEQIDTQSSLFANWKAPLPEENNFSQYLKSCNLKTRTGNKNTYEYTTAKGDVNCLKMTHSTYWYQSKNITDGSVKKDPMDDNCIKEVVELVPVTEEIKKEEVPIQQTSNRYPISNISPQTSENSEKSFTITKPPQQTSTNDNNKRIRIESSNGLAGYKTDEVYVYVRGRGRGRYVCERCGIRCKKPSMLKKHLNSHTDIRPFKCIQCNFSFKTKGNLTKHLLSKAHSRKLAEQKSGIELSDQPTTSINNILSSDEGQLQIITEDPSEAADIVKMGKHEAAFMNIDNESDDEDENRRAPVYERNIYRKYGQEVIIHDRRAHTPPSLWCNPFVPEDTPTWAEPEFNRSCQSAPPASFSEHEIENEEDTRKKQDFQKTIQRIRNESISMVSFLDEMSFANPINTPTKINNKHQNLCSNKDLNDNNGCQINGQINNMKINISNHLNTTTMDSFLAKDVNEYACDICEKKFRKEQEWILHQHTHTIEKNSHRVKNYYCPKCRTCTRSKTSMIKHIEAFHTLNASTIKSLFLEKLNNNEEISLSGHVSPNENSSNSSTSSTPTYNMNNGSRTFLCNDCNKGFRTHGVLAKHLRSQQHITKMSILGKLNEDQTCALRRNPHCLTKVDTKDCDAARQSIISKANEILEDEKNGITPVMTVIPNDNKT